MTTNYPIAAPQAAMAYAMAMRRVADLMIGAVENNDGVMAGMCIMQFHQWSCPNSDVPGPGATGLMLATIVGTDLDAVTDAVTQREADFAQPIVDIEQDLYRAMSIHYGEVMK